MEFIYAKLNRQLEKSVYKGEKSSTISVTVDNKEQTIQAEISATKLYLHKIKLILNSATNNDSAIVYVDYYCKYKEPFTDCVFTHMNNINEYLVASGSYSFSGDQQKHSIMNLSIVPNQDDYDFIINSGEFIYHSQDGYMRTCRIEDNVVGYILKE